SRTHAADRRAARDRRQRGDRHPRAALPGDAGGAARSRDRDPLRMTALLAARGVRKVFAGGDGQPLEVLRAVELEVHRGEFVAIVGASGAGKSTLLHLLGALDRPSGGDVWLDGSRYSDLDANALAEIRNRKLGFVFQFHHLLREFSALENVMMPLVIGGTSEREARSRAEEVLSEVGLAGRMTHRPAELSGGEQQRWAVSSPRSTRAGPACCRPRRTACAARRAARRSSTSGNRVGWAARSATMPSRRTCATCCAASTARASTWGSATNRPANRPTRAT